MLTLDCRGQRCPLPILVLARRIGEVEVGELVMVQATDPAAGPDIKAWCRMRQHEYVQSGEADDGTPTYTVRRRH